MNRLAFYSSIISIKFLIIYFLKASLCAWRSSLSFDSKYSCWDWNYSFKEDSILSNDSTLIFNHLHLSSVSLFLSFLCRRQESKSSTFSLRIYSLLKLFSIDLDLDSIEALKITTVVHENHETFGGSHSIDRSLLTKRW